MKNIYHEISSALESGKKAALCTVVNTKGSVPGKTGFKMVVYDDTSIYGTIGGGSLEKQVIKDALEIINKNKPGYFKHDLLHHHNMCCGGVVEIFIEPVMNNKKLYIYGAGHVGEALAAFAVNFDFDVYVIDDRKEYIDKLEISGVNKLNLKHDAAVRHLPADKNTFIVIVTYDHQIDRDILSYYTSIDTGYLGMIGSKRKIQITEKMLYETGKNKNGNVHMPIGIDINAQTPQEIAVSILAELIKIKNSGKNG